MRRQPHSKSHKMRRNKSELLMGFEVTLFADCFPLKKYIFFNFIGKTTLENDYNSQDFIW